MKIIVFGATGRVGTQVVEQGLAAGHDLTVFVRDANRLSHNCGTVVLGDVRDKVAVTRALAGAFDAVVMCLGTGALKPSTLVTDGMRAIITGMRAAGIDRLLAVSGTAEMAEKTALGWAYTAILKRTPVGHAVRDHDGALALVQASGLSWVLAGCNYIGNGKARGRYKTRLIFPGGFKTIRPGDVADFLLAELSQKNHHQQVVGIWY